MPAGIEISVLSDRSTTVRDAVAHVRSTLAVTSALVVLVIFLFLRRFWATAIPSVTVPVSLAGTIGVVYLLGYSLDVLSLMALTISVGFVVDDAIIVVETAVVHARHHRTLHGGVRDHLGRCDRDFGSRVADTEPGSVRTPPR